MAVVNATIVTESALVIRRDPVSGGNTFAVPAADVVPLSAIKVLWAAGATGDTGQWVQIPDFGDKCVHVYGTTITSVTIQGSNNVDANGVPTDPITLTDQAGTTLVFATTGLRQILQSPQFIRPLYTTATAVIVVIVGRKGKDRIGS